jgi:hypothetical protein
MVKVNRLQTKTFSQDRRHHSTPGDILLPVVMTMKNILE